MVLWAVLPVPNIRKGKICPTALVLIVLCRLPARVTTGTGRRGRRRRARIRRDSLRRCIEVRGKVERGDSDRMMIAQELTGIQLPAAIHIPKWDHNIQTPFPPSTESAPHMSLQKRARSSSLSSLSSASPPPTSTRKRGPHLALPPSNGG